MMRIATLIWLGILGLMIAGLFQVKYEVQKLENTLAGIRKDNRQVSESINILRAEWGYLSRPDRVARLGKSLDLEPVTNKQTADFDRLPLRFDRPLTPDGALIPLPTPPNAIPRPTPPSDANRRRTP